MIATSPSSSSPPSKSRVGVSVVDPNPLEAQKYGHHDDAGAAERMDGVAAFSDVPPPPPPEQEGHHHVVDAGDGGMPMIAANSNQLTLLFQGEVYVFESVTPEKVPPLPLKFFY